MPPYLRLTRAGPGVSFAGLAECTLGRPLYNPATGQDEGVFARWAWDGSQLTAEVDPLGFFSLFVWHDGESVMISPSVLQLIAQGADPTPDARALSVFYRMGMFINEDTPFAAIKVLPPGGRLTWSEGRLSITRHDMPIAEQSLTRDAAVEGIIDLTRASLRNISEASPEKLVLPLSGGRDSRHILLGLDHLGARPERCVTYQHCGAELNSEARAARAICERLGVRHEVLGQPRPMTGDILRSLTLTSLCSDEHAQMLPMHDYLARQSGAALDGIGGDILTNPDSSAAEQYARAQRGDYAGIARAMMAGHAKVLRRPGSAEGPGEVYAGLPEEETVAYVAEAIARFRDAPDPYQCFWFWHRTRREIGFVSSALFASGKGVFCPYLDTRFVQFCLTLPWAVTQDRMLHDDALTRGYPETRDVAFGDSFAPAAAARATLSSRMRKVSMGLGTLRVLQPQSPLAEGRQFLLGSPALRRQPGEVYQFHNLAVTGMDAGLAQRLLDRAAGLYATAPQALVSDVFDPREAA
ncbi:asparagine synthase-related protein [Roseivivax sp.]